MADIRQDAVHKLSHREASEFSVIGIEDLNVKGTSRNGTLGRRCGYANVQDAS
ncbi:MAG: hypothetical protein D4R76_04010 [Methylococcus sp.]|nr:MAG: hypothetical protein D4R76_04010 [Methylococcus sp.]